MASRLPLPLHISLADKLLASRITLPPLPLVIYTIFSPTTASSHPHEDIELARRLILVQNASAPLLDSLLTSVSIGAESLIYVFLVASPTQRAGATTTLQALRFDGLSVIESSSFSLNNVYPCSSACSSLSTPCQNCLDPLRRASLLPRKSLRTVYSHFLEAVRSRIIDDIAQVSTSRLHSQGLRRQVKRLKGGFLLSPPPTSGDWGSGWHYRALARPLIYCHLMVHLSRLSAEGPSHLVVHPTVLPTPYLPLPQPLPLPAGTPITLLPHGTPAYFLANYTGPTSALTKQFQDSLRGMGVREWEGEATSNIHTFSLRMGPEPGERSTYIIAWINVENKQGEDKGITIIYPTKLCLSFVPSSTPRQTLDYIPELPAQLQPSPQVPPQVPPLSASILASLSAPSPDISTLSPHPSPLSHPHRPVLSSSPTSDSLRAFRTLTLSKSKDIRRVASEVGAYVDSVARERERERERLKREREGGVGGSPRLSRTTTTTPAPPTFTTTSVENNTTLPTPAPPSAQQVPQPPHPTASAANTQQQAQSASQNFYPSPPQTNPAAASSSNLQTSPVMDTASLLPISDTPATTTTAIPVEAVEGTITAASSVPSTSTSTSTTYDPFGNIDPTWSQQSQPYLDMDLDMDFGMDMGLSFGMDSMGSGRGGGGTYDDHSGGMDFEDAFTDDDFSFFDRPSQGIVAPPPAPPPGGAAHTHHRVGSGGVSSGLTSAAGAGSLNMSMGISMAGMGLGMSLPIFGDIHLSGPGPPHQLPTPHSHITNHSSPWVSNTLAEGFTPRFSSTVDHDTLPPDLVPASPGQTPESHSLPATPSVYLAPEYDLTIRRPSTSGVSGSGSGSSCGFGCGPPAFDPIPFASYHRAADGKYAIGKFALPSPPPDEEDGVEPFSTTLPSYPPSPNATNGWRFRYNAATDPRIGVVRKLIGVKRKTTFEQGLREGLKMSPAWVREHEDWDRSAAGDERGEAGEEDVKSEPESEDEDPEEADSPLVSRPSTPPPAYLPLGPTLLHTQFQHSHLLPLSTPLRPPGAAVAPTNLILTVTPTSVPTPVSPAAAMGASSEKSKSLEAAAHTVAREVVENCLWADAWRANTLSAKQSAEVWSSDVKNVAQYLEAAPGMEGPLDMSSLFGLESTSGTLKSFQRLESPMVSIAKGDAIIQILPTALRFWEKLGLGPRGGTKDVTAFVLFEDDGQQLQQQVETWLASVAAAYHGKRLGMLVPGISDSCSSNGLFPLRFDSSFRKSLASFVASLPAPQASLVFFIVTPLTTMTLASPLLRQVFSAVKKALKTYSEAQILFQFVPEQLVLGSVENPASHDSDVEILCYSVYNRILQPVDRLMSRRFFDHGERVRNYFQEPAVTLARPVYNKVTYARTPHASLDVMDRHTLLHIGYQVSPCGKWILAACVDQRGEGHDLGVWLTQTPGEDADMEISEEAYLVAKVWDFAVQFAKKANIEWRIVFAKLGTMGESELNAWTRHLSGAILTCHELPLIHVTVLSVEPDAPWMFVTAHAPPPHKPSATRSSSSPKHHATSTIFTDVTSTTYALFPSAPVPISLPPSPSDLGLSLSFVAEPPCSSPSTPHPLHEPHSIDPPDHPHPLSLLPRSTTILVRVPRSPSATSITMLQIHLLHTVQSPNPSSSPMPDESRLHADITHSYHDLAVLANVQWRLRVNPILPFHLAAVDAMRIALDRDQDRTDGIVDS